MEQSMQTGKHRTLKVVTWLLIPAAWVPLLFLIRWALESAMGEQARNLSRSKGCSLFSQPAVRGTKYGESLSAAVFCKFIHSRARRSPIVSDHTQSQAARCLIRTITHKCHFLLTWHSVGHAAAGC